MRFVRHTLALAIIGQVALFAALASISSPARAEESAALSSQQIHKQRDSFARDFADKVLAIIQDTKESFADRKDILRRAFAKSVDIDWIARFVAGNAWSKATDEQKEKYTELYRKYLTESYVTNFAENPEKRIRDIKIFGVNDSDADQNKFTVRTQMQLADQEDVNVNYLVHEKEGHYKVLDIVIENVSLITTHRAQFSKLAASQGLGSVIAKLEKMVGGDTPNLSLSMN